DNVEKNIFNAIIDAIKENPKVTQKMLSETIGLSRRAIEWNMNKLKESKKIQRVGGKKDGYWVTMTD
ncbi:MAG: winged helix-turn-helix transcriptional regulator, partial [Capnocytophaga sp.]|nr:winged helix-turn-helix transcriptional regulator [Capnocytophaga sp.]